MTPILNWREIEILATQLDHSLKDLFLERIIVPERPEFPGGFLKGEWVLRFEGKKSSASLLLSVRPRHPYTTLLSGRGPRAAPSATHSSFSLQTAKLLKGARLQGIAALPRERVLIMTFSGEETLALVISLIPANPEVLLVKMGPGPPPWPILARSRPTREETTYSLPNGLQAPSDLEIRHDLFKDGHSLADTIEKELKREAFEIRWAALARVVRQQLKYHRDGLLEAQKQIEGALAEPDWQHWGELLKSVLHSPPTPEGPKGKQYVTVEEFPDQTPVQIPVEPDRSLSEQAKRYFQLAKRRQRRIQESTQRAHHHKDDITRLESLPLTIPDERNNDWSFLEKLERQLGLVKTDSTRAERTSSWKGKTYFSKEGLPILVGRNRAENLELTFKIARGNDLWMHLRGRPGAHVVIPLSSGKSASLETLLDAAALTLYYSNGQSWGKTEVDYTFKKYVKRIRDSSEASYTHNKTLIISPDSVRIKRLMEGLE